MQFCRTPKSVPDLSFRAWSTRPGALIQCNRWTREFDENSQKTFVFPVVCVVLKLRRLSWEGYLNWPSIVISWPSFMGFTGWNRYHWPLVGCNLRQEFGSLEPQNMPTKRLMRLSRQSECGSPGALITARFSALGERRKPCAKRSTKMRKRVCERIFHRLVRVTCWRNFLRPNWKGDSVASVAGASMGIAELGDME